MASETQSFPFAADPRYRFAARFAGVDAGSARVEVSPDGLVVRFGPWRLETPLANVAAATLSGPYRMLKTIGPPHLSFKDRGVTFATNGRRGVCISFLEPVAAIDPLHVLRHPAATVTVEDPDALIGALLDERLETLDAHQMADEIEARDDLHGMSASELRDLAKELEIAHTSSDSKARLIEKIETTLGAGLGSALED
jgi:hypothetical protein